MLGRLVTILKIYRDDEHLWKNIFCQVLDGICELQAHNVVHADLHLGNILLDYSTPQLNSKFTCLIHDFGHSIEQDMTFGTVEYTDIEKFTYSISKSVLSDTIKEYAEEIYEMTKSLRPMHMISYEFKLKYEEIPKIKASMST